MDGATALAELKHVLYESAYDGAWTEDTLNGYLSEGQDKFCEEVGLFIDPLSYSITTEAAVADYKLNPRVIRVFDAYIAGVPLTRYDAKHGNVVRNELSSGKPQFFRTDHAPGYVRLVPVPDDVYTITLRVWRYAKQSFEDSGEFEIPSQFHRACIEWAAYKALNHHDMELQDPVKAADHFAAFGMYVQRGKEWIHQLLGVEYEPVPNSMYVV